MLDEATLEAALTTLGELLESRGHTYELAAIGGRALLLLGYVDRPTKDLDIVALVKDGAWLSAKPFPEALDEAVADVAAALDLPPNWLNPGPTSMLDFGLPDGCEARVVRRTFGSLVIDLASRADHVAFKLYAAADHWPDHSRHLQDLERLHPTEQELRAAAEWCRTHDPPPGFRDSQLLPVLRRLGIEDHNGA